MIDHAIKIVPFNSVGNITLGENIDKYLDEISQKYKVENSEYLIPNGEKRLSFYLEDSIVVATLENGEIISITCKENFQGKCLDKFYPSQTLGEIISMSKRQRIFNGCLIIDDNFGFCFELPSPYDEIAYNIKAIPLELKLNSIVVADFSFWVKKKKYRPV